MGEILKTITDQIVTLKIDEIQETVKKALQQGIEPLTIVKEGLAPGMGVVGDKFEKGEYFLAELVVAGETFKEAMQILQPELTKKGQTATTKGTVVLGTVRGDLHDIGKNIVGIMLRAAGYDVQDIGNDVTAQQFVDKVKETNASVVAMSALLTTTMVEMGSVVKALEEAGVRGQVKVIVGGAPLTDDYAKQIGADAYGQDAVKAVEICDNLLGH